jgi:hypothetical protein
VLAALVAVLGAAAFAGMSSSANGAAERAGCAGSSGNGYTYAGHQARAKGHGVRATVTPLRLPQVAAGHVSAWVGVGGPGQGARGEDSWIQAGIARVAGAGPFVYAEVTRGGRAPDLRILRSAVTAGAPVRLAVLEVAGRPGHWQVWLDGRAVTGPLRLAGSSGRFAPIATAEAWNGGQGACNAFSFRFERVSVSRERGGAWRPFVPGHDFLDRGYRLTRLAGAQAGRSLAGSRRTPSPYAFVAASS